MIKRYDGFVDQMINLIKDSPNLIKSMEDFKLYLDEHLKIENIVDEVNYVKDFKEGVIHLTNIMLDSSNKKIIELNSKDPLSNDHKFFRVSKLCEIFDFSKGTITIWKNKGILKNYRQVNDGKVGNKLEIPFCEINRIVNEIYPKYKNAWIHYNKNN
jgi:hypothetical protein